MRAVVVTPKEKESARVVERSEPVAREEECLLRPLMVGIDGTDREIDAGEYGTAPGSDDGLIPGHESLAVVERAAAKGKGPARGDLVVATVRRSCPQRCPNCAAGEYDFCSTGDYLERGIKGAHGYLAELYTERPEHLIVVPPELGDAAVLLEPFSILERAYRQIREIQRRLIWLPRRVIITGAGNMGVIAALLARLRGLDTLVFSRGEQQGAAGRILARIGAEYVNSEQRSLAETAEEFGAPDIVIEGTGYSPFAWEGVEVLAINGIACLLSVTGGDRSVKIRSDELNTRMVLGNRLVFGSVNAHRRDFESGAETIQAILTRWEGVLDWFITHRRSLDEIREALAEDDPDELKTVIEMGDA